MESLHVIPRSIIRLLYISEMKTNLELINAQGVSVVIPCFNSEKTLGKVLSELKMEFSSWQIENYEVILVMDSPQDKTIDVALDHQEENHRIVILELNKNFGQHAAIFAGLNEVKFNFIVTMDDDGQHPVSELYALLSPLCEDFDVVYGVAAEDRQSFFRNIFSKFSKYLVFKLLKIQNAKEMSAFRAFKKIAISGIDLTKLTNAVVDVVLNWNTNRFHSVKIDMLKRSEGKSNYSLYSLLKMSIQLVTGYSVRPLRIASIVGLITFVGSFTLLAFITTQAVRGEIVVAGYASLSLFVLFLGSIQLLSLGLIGEYLGKVHEHSMGKPHYVVKRIFKS